MKLAEDRANNLAKYLLSQIQLPDSLIQIDAVGINWDALYRAVGETSLPNKAQVQGIILSQPESAIGSNSILFQLRKQQLQNLDGGRTWNWMMKHLYPELRSSASMICYLNQFGENSEISEEVVVKDQPPVEALAADADTVSVSMQLDSEMIATVIEEEPAGKTDPPKIALPKYPIFALRSNLLLPLLNIGAEMPIGNRWSVGADYYNPWMPRKADHKNCFQLSFVSAEGRYWIGNKHTNIVTNRANRLLGNSVGVYGAWGYYDIEHNYHGNQGHFWSFGADYLYAVPIFKGKLHLEFELAFGAILSRSKPYDVKEVGGVLIRDKGMTKKIDYFGPTKIGVSLVVPLWRSVKPSQPIIVP